MLTMNKKQPIIGRWMTSLLLFGTSSVSLELLKAFSHNARDLLGKHYWENPNLFCQKHTDLNFVLFKHFFQYCQDKINLYHTNSYCCFLRYDPPMNLPASRFPFEPEEVVFVHGNRFNQYVFAQSMSLETMLRWHT